MCLLACEFIFAVQTPCHVLAWELLFPFPWMARRNVARARARQALKAALQAAFMSKAEAEAEIPLDRQPRSIGSGFGAKGGADLSLGANY